MPKKKQVRNAFYFFMLDYKERCERNGERFPNGLKEVAEHAGPEWSVLPASLRKRYEQMAKEEKERSKGDSARKYTNQHNSFESIERQKMEEEEAKNTMNSYIENLIRSLATKKLLAEHKFYLMHINYFCITEGECYHPAELAVTEFNLGEGVTNVYHTIIDPGQIPLGYRHDATTKSNETHKIPIESPGGEKDFYKIWMNIKKILEPGRSANFGAYPPIYTMSDNINLNTSMSCVKSVIKTLCEVTEDDDPDKFQVYSLEKLLYELRNACAEIAAEDPSKSHDGEMERYPNIGFARLELEKDVFNYTFSLACSFHSSNTDTEERPVEFCSKSYVQRWVFLICDICCQDLNIKVIPGKHLPMKIDENFRLSQLAKEEEKKVPAAKPITWIDHSKRQPGWVPVQQPPLAPPKTQSSVVTPAYGPIDSDENFPAIRTIPFGRGRGRVPGSSRGGSYSNMGRGSTSWSFADAMKHKK